MHNTDDKKQTNLVIICIYCTEINLTCVWWELLMTNGLFIFVPYVNMFFRVRE